MPSTAAPARRSAGFNPHVGAGDSPFAALAPTPPRTSSLSVDGDLTAFAARSGNGAWPSLPRAQVAARLVELVRDPTPLNQAGLNACGSAAAMYLFAKRRPERFARFAMELYDAGVASFGSIAVSGDGLKHKDPAKMAWAPGTAPHPLDWMMLSAVLRSAGDLLHFGGEPSDEASGITLPGELETWLRDGVGYASVTNEANKFLTRDLDHLRRLAPGPDLDVVLLVNVDVVPLRSTATALLEAIGRGARDAVTRRFPNHWPVLQAPVTDDGTRIAATTWTWGRSGYVFDAPHGDWADGYYGAIQARP
jgi:hypothetical protein